jgi:hypothetical protein
VLEVRVVPANEVDECASVAGASVLFDRVAQWCSITRSTILYSFASSEDMK